MPSHKIVITDFGDPDYSLESEQFRAAGLDVNLVFANSRKAEELMPVIADADGLIVQWANISRPMMEAMTRCRVISRYGIGVDMVDLAAATDCGIMVANVPDYCVEEVSTHTIAFLLMLNRHIPLHAQHVRSGHWGGVPGGPPARLSGQTLGIVGLGNIGKAVARKASGVGFKLVGYDPYLAPAQAADLGVELMSLTDLLRTSDYVTLHCPLNDETRGLIGGEQLALMKRSAYLINMARGPIVVQRALYEALSSGAISGAAVDVLEQEPPDPADPLLQLDNLTVTPHIASWSAESLLQLRRDTAQNVVEALLGRWPRSVVNRRALGRG